MIRLDANTAQIQADLDQKVDVSGGTLTGVLSLATGDPGGLNFGSSSRGVRQVYIGAAAQDAWQNIRVGENGLILLLARCDGNDNPSGCWVLLKNSTYDNATITQLAYRSGFGGTGELEVQWAYGLNNPQIRITEKGPVNIRLFFIVLG